MDNYDAKGDGIWFSFEKADEIDSLPVVDGDQVAIKWVWCFVTEL